MRKVFRAIASFLIRISAFVTKEFFSVISQPRLLAVLVLGPFLILLVFGISYRDIYQTLRMSVVYPPNDTIEASVRAFSEASVSGIEIVDVTTNAAGALSSLENQQVDLVMVIPENAIEDLEANRQAEFNFYHQEIDPFEVTYADIVAHRVTQEVNQQLLLAAIEQSKQQAQVYRDEIRSLSESSDSLLGEEGQPVMGTDSVSAPQIMWLLLQIASGQTDGAVLEGSGSLLASPLDENNGSEAPTSDLERVDALLTRFIDTDARMIVQPFQREVLSLNNVDIQPVHFYIPAVIALLLQHLAISLAGLSIVSERFAGTMEVMRAAPVNAFEVLLGKYLSFSLFLGFLAAVLTGLVHWALGVPMLGSLAVYALIVFLVILVSLGLGFLISNFASSASQAVQFSMVVLLASIFFTGFFLPLYRLWWPAQVISWSLPATYGLQMLQDNMLQGLLPAGWLFWALAGAAVGLFIANWLRLRSLMVQN